ncbi:MAG: radical SAM protein [Candidatus Woesearchaeota archaeon]|jgi:hypothetical protein
MDRDYIYSEPTISICPVCLLQISAKIIIKNNQVFLKKFCKSHGETEELLEEDAAYHLSKKEFDKPGTISKTQTKIDKGCPFDCGLCPNHDQHTCISLIEVTNACNLNCPVCYAGCGNMTNKKNEVNNNYIFYLSLSKISKMIDFLLDSENGKAEILQISGGEPTLHPDIIKIISLAREKGISYVMLNTNGIRIANDEEFVKQLANFKGKFEVYLQFDSFSDKTNNFLRGKDITSIKLKAIENLTKYNIPVTLVCTVQNKVNDSELGKILRFGMDTKGIRGVNFQPIAFFGKFNNVENLKNNINITKDRITLSGVIQRIENQISDVFIKGDIVPLPCNVQRVAVSYLFRSKNKKFIPITRTIKVKSYLPLIDNTFMFDADSILKNKSKSIFSCDCFANKINLAAKISRFLPSDFLLWSSDKKLSFIDNNTFRVSISSFIDVYNFDLKSMQKECVHVITPDFKKIPFSAYNMFYRDSKLNKKRADALRKRRCE